MSATSLYDVFRATIILGSTVASKLVYCSPAWFMYCSAADINRLDAFLKRCKRYGCCPDDFPNISELFSDADDQPFSRISHVTHVLKPLLPTRTQHSYNLRASLIRSAGTAAVTFSTTAGRATLVTGSPTH